MSRRIAVLVVADMLLVMGIALAAGSHGYQGGFQKNHDIETPICRLDMVWHGR